MAKRAVRKKPPAPSLGFQDDQALMTPGPARDRLLSQMRLQGRDVRLNAIYGKVRQGGHYNFAQLDEVVNAALAHGLRPQFTLMGTPSYNPNLDQGLSAKNNDPRLWRQYAQTVAQHFKGRVGRYSIGNEPNYKAFLEGADTDPAKAGRTYRGMYQSGYAGVKAADKSAQVLLGEITSQPNAKAFLQSVLAGKPLKTAGLAYHPYDENHPNSWDIDDLKALQSTLGRYKRQGKLQTTAGKAAPLYLTEFGYQRGETTDPIRLKKLAVAYAKARESGARQFLQYQMTPKQRPVTPGAVSTDAYGSQSQGAGKPGWIWDTGIGDAHGNIPTINRGLRLAAPRARVARKVR